MKFVWVKGHANSREVYKHLGNSTTPISRASVINFLNRMVDEGILTYRDGTGKGGHHRTYYLGLHAKSEEEFKSLMSTRIREKAKTELS